LIKIFRGTSRASHASTATLQKGDLATALVVNAYFLQKERGVNNPTLKKPILND
jgi:hypothetical protein